MSDTKKSWLDRAGAIHLWKTIEAMLGTKVDKIEGFGLSSNDYTTEEKKKLASLSDPKTATTENNGLMSSADKAKLDGIEAGANKSVEDPTIILDKLNPSDKPVADDTNLIVKNSEGVYSRSPLILLWNWIKSKTDTLYAVAGHTHNYAGSIEPGGDALNAMKLNGLSTSTDGDKNVYGTIPIVSSESGVTELGKYIDFHATKDSENDYDVRITVADAGEIQFDGIDQIANITANLHGTADFANGTLFDKEQWVSLTDLDQNTWYPVVSMN